MLHVFEGTFGFDQSGNIVASKEALAYAIFDEVMADDEEDENEQQPA